MKRLLPAALAIALLGLPQAEGRKWYLSSSVGSDEGDGTEARPWKSLAKISTTPLAPGDAVRFRRGDRFCGHFVVNGSGTAAQPIRIGAYGEGEAPVLTGQAGAAAGGDFQEAVLVRNHDNLVFADLCIENERRAPRTGVDDVDAYGIHVQNTGPEPMRNFVFQGLEFRNVYAVKPMLRPEDFNGLEVAGLRIASSRNQRRGEEKNISNVLVENCRFSDIQRLGVHIKHGGGKEGVGNDALNRNTDFVVRNNEFHHLGGTCVLPMRTFNCLIENNGTPLFMRNNLFFGAIDPRLTALDESPVQADPGFRMTGEGAARFRLRPDSPARAAGTAADVPPIPGAGSGVFKNLTAWPAADAFGNPLKPGGKKPVIGAGE